MTTPTGGTQHCSNNQVGNAGSYSWSIWSSGSGGCITTFGTSGAFEATWNNAGDFLAGVGLSSPSKNIAADFAETKSGTGGGYSYIGIYGWSTNPLHEFYITEDWFGSGHPNPGGTKVGTITVDGGAYDVYQHTQVNQPSIQGTTTFVQYFSVRQTPRSCGHISVAEHFSQWATLGLQLGSINSARLLVEAGGGSGSATFSTATMTAN